MSDAEISLTCELSPSPTHRIGRHLHAVFGEFYGRAIYDGTWVGRDSDITIGGPDRTRGTPWSGCCGSRS